MTDIHIVRDYPHPPAKVWRALTEPALIALWRYSWLGNEGEAPTFVTYRLDAEGVLRPDSTLPERFPSTPENGGT